MSTGGAEVTILFLGDVVGRPGRDAVRRFLPELKQCYQPDLVIANGENAAGGRGIDGATADELRQCGCQIITLGDHTWDRNQVRSAFEARQDWLIRPHNYPPGAVGRGWAVVACNHVRVGVMNLLGRIFISGSLDCPFRAADSLIAELAPQCDILFCDFHAEATSEKAAFARHVDGRVACVVGTHTHVPTADERILPGGTAAISDVGMCGVLDGVIGMDASVALNRFISGLPERYELADGPGAVQGIVCKISVAAGKAISIERVIRSG